MEKVHVVAFAGGVGGAKLAAGLQACLPPGSLTVIVNTGDDFEHWGLTICPDLDTVLYNLAGINDPEQGWGRADETFHTLATMKSLGAESWFRLGDSDLALHLRRTQWLKQGLSLTEVTHRLSHTFGIPSRILPMCDTPVRTLVHTAEGDLPFQQYFVRRRCQPEVIDLSYVGAAESRMSDEVLEALEAADLVLFCPSNPYLSIDPILSVGGLRRKLRRLPVPVVAVTPIVSGKALKGPAAKLMRELGFMASPITVADHFDGLLDGFVLDQQDAVLKNAVALPVLVTDTVMGDLESKRELARQVVAFGSKLTIDGTARRMLSSTPDATLQ